jgi:rhamnogalacturonan endolyase
MKKMWHSGSSRYHGSMSRTYEREDGVEQNRSPKGCVMTMSRVAAAFTLCMLSLLVSVGVAQRGNATPQIEKTTVHAPVTLTDNGESWTLDNGIVKITLAKRDANLSSIVYHGVEILSQNNHSYWEQRPSGAVTARVTIDPASNGGERAEVSVKGVYDPATGGNGRGRTAMDIESRFTMERGSSGFYTYDEYTHRASYPAAGFGENRFILQDLNPAFDWLSVDHDRNQLMSQAPEAVTIHAKEQAIYTSGLYKNSVEHKYSYNAPMYKLTAWGWSSTKDHIGVYFMNPSNEYIGGGPEKLDLIDHLSSPGSPDYRAIVLDYWTSGHYAGGSINHIPAGEEWKHVVGPIFVYFNALDHARDPTRADLDKLTASFGSGMPDVPKVWHDNSLALWDDAVATSKAVKAAWPFPWVEGVDYPHKDGRATVTGQLVLNDPQAATKTLPHLNVGLSHPDYLSSAGGFERRAGNGPVITYAHDGDYYEFWVDGSENGRFTIPNVRPGTYTLHAFADGVLGEFAKTSVTVEAGKPLDLGKLTWQPVRYGKQLWEIGYPDRTGDKFFKGDGANYWLWGWGLRYAGLFPNDITYTVGKSDYRRDWFFQEVPHSTTTAWMNPAAKDPYNQRFGWVKIPDSSQDMWQQWGQGRATTWTVKFNMPKAVPSAVSSTVHGSAVLRIALAGADGGNGNSPSSPGTLTIGVNGQTAGSIHPVATNALRYNTNKGVWNQYAVTFDATLLKPGENSMTLSVPAGDVTTGVVWDYLRLELNDGRKAYMTPPATGRLDVPTPIVASAANQ